MLRASDIRELRKLTQEVAKWAREMDATLYGPDPAGQPAPRPIPMLPPVGEQYSYILCKVCQAPAILLRDRKNPAGVAIACIMCREISALPEGLKNFKLE